MLLEQRLARNLILVDFHTCVGPVILGRVLNKIQNSSIISEGLIENDWQSQWCLVLRLFVWLTQLLRKEEADRLSRSVGKWLIASADAGALDDVCVSSIKTNMEDKTNDVHDDICAIFGGPFLHEAEKSRRLRVALPVVPALVISLLRKINLADKHCPLEDNHYEVKALTKLLAAAAVATKSIVITQRDVNNRPLFGNPSGDLEDDLDWGEWSGVSIMLKIVNRLESLLKQNSQNHIKSKSCLLEDKNWIVVEGERDVSNNSRRNELLQEMKACQDLALDTCATILVKAAASEGARIDLWQSWSAVINALTADESFFSSVLKEADLDKEPLEAIQKIQSLYAEDIFSRLSCMVIHQTLGGALSTSSSSVHKENNINLCDVASGLIPLINIVAEHHVLHRLARVNGNVISHQICKTLSTNQSQLLLLIISFLRKGREELGWCSFDEYRHSLLIGNDVNESDQQSMDDTSRILLPLLRPALSIVLETYTCSIYNLLPNVHEELIKELKLTLTAAMVGLHPLSTARDVGFEAISVLRRVGDLHCEKVETNRRKKCFTLISYVANEMRVRMKNDRQIRRDFLKTNFPDGGDRSRSSSYDTTDEVAHELVESFILGTQSPMVPIRPNNPDYFKAEGHTFEGKAGDEHNAALEVVLEQLFLPKQGHVKDDFDEEHSQSVVSNLKEYLNDYEKDNALYHEDMRMLYMVDSSSKNTNDVLDHADAVAQFLDISAKSSSATKTVDGSSTSNSPEALQYRRLLRCTTHTDALTIKFLTECLCGVCESRISRYEKGLNDGGASGAHTRIATYPISNISLFDRSIPKHFFGSDGNYKIDYNENENVKKAVSLTQRSSLTITDITKINVDGDDEMQIDLKSNTVEQDDGIILHQSDSMDFEWDGTGLEEASRNRSDTASSSENALSSPNKSLESVSLSSSRYESTCCPADGSFASGGTGRIMARSENVLHVRAEGSRTGTLILTNTNIIIEYDSELFDGELLSVEEEKQRKFTTSDSHNNSTVNPDIDEISKRYQRLIASLRPRSFRWSLAEISHIYLRRYRLRDSSLEIFFIPSAGNGIGLTSAMSSIFLDFGTGKIGNTKRDDMADAVMRLAPGRCVKQWPDKSAIFMQEAVQRAQSMWTNGKMSNFDYLLELNTLAGRSFNDLCQYPICP